MLACNGVTPGGVVKSGVDIDALQQMCTYLDSRLRSRHG